ncbi:hypothetical protein FA15DRAFT_670164 [Coprinopsis marcescibilis]|uniref:CHAT domain-containing protein n=1 Tax=Coprinopsis marcescibilis TaxID=230819 RepID=A0A5C3KUA6_COPMA|nr:hypothetical protein FA15DRAFT_670164 [Coprinopsis marcescibilis]
MGEEITWLRRAVACTSPCSPHLPARLNNLGGMFLRRFKQAGGRSDIADAMAVLQQAVLLTPPDSADLPRWLTNLGYAFLCRFEQTGELSDIVEAITSQRRAVELTPPGHEDLPGWLSNLGTSFRHCFERTGELSDIAKAITSQQRAVELTPPGHVDLPRLLGNLGNSFLRRFERTGELSDIAEAIASQQRAVELTPPGHADLPTMLSHLGSSFSGRFERTGKLSDIAEAIAQEQRAVELTPPGHADFPRLLSNLGNSFLRCFAQTGELSDIAEAIASQQRAVELTPLGHANLPARLSSLGNSFLRRFERAGELYDIAEAITLQQRAVDLPPPGHADLPRWLSNLGNSFLRRFERTGQLTDIAEAIASQQRAVELTAPGHADLPTMLSHLGSSFSRCFERTGKLSDIAEAITSLQRAIELTPPGHAHLPKRLGNLGNSFLNRFERTGEPSDIAEAIASQQRAVELTPPGHADLPGCLSNYGKSLETRFHKTLRCDDLKESLAHYKSAATATIGPPSVKFNAAKQWATLIHHHFPASPETLLAFKTAVRLISVIAGLEQTVQHRHSQLQSISSFTLQAAAAACALGRPDKAIEWLEQGRCLVWTQLNRLRTPLDDLRVSHPDLAHRVLDISKALESAGSRAGQSSTDTEAPISEKVGAEEKARSHIYLAKEWDNILDTIRSTVPGFENFLLPPSCTTLLQNLPESGWAIVINVHKDRSDALALRAGLDKPIHIELPSFSPEKAEKLRENLTKHLVDSKLRMREVEADEEDGRGCKPVGLSKGTVLRDVLAYLWKEVVKPIFDALELARSPPELPRIWWCATGPLAFLPLHAAGLYEKMNSHAVFDYAVSSYTPTATFLTNRVRNAHKAPENASGLFLVSQPSTPGLSRIPGTTKEVRAIQTQLATCGVRHRMLEGEAATIEAGLKEMDDYSCVHLACHAIQSKAEPLQSGFYFHDGPLSLSTIIKKDLKHADLAFLSACQTSTGEEKLSEEAVHLAGGMLAAGYRGVVATMWSIRDQQAPQVAGDFYEYLLAEDGARWMDRERHMPSIMPRKI